MKRVAILDDKSLITNVILKSMIEEGDIVINDYSTQWIGDTWSEEQEKTDIVNRDIKLAKDWRDEELSRTGLLVQEPDHPYMNELLEYRKRLRAYDQEEGFPYCDKPQPALTTHGKEI